jgi:membrane-bound lytic murein transglycosylase MltF
VRSPAARKRFQDTAEYLKRYSNQYNFDWLMIAAQGYQESKLDQRKRSKAGAIGIMQLMPTTARDKNVNIPDIEKAEKNIHAGVRYLRFLRDRYFNEPELSALDKALFSFAAYNAGPRSITRARKRAKAMGYDPNQWFGNVEIGAARAISREPVIYIRNIYKYYIMYKRLNLLKKAKGPKGNK